MAIAWLLIWGTVFLVMLCFAVEVGRIYLAQSELETALEAAALSGAKEWQATTNTILARDYAVDYAKANTVNDQPVTLDRNETASIPGNPNGNTSVTGELVLGKITLALGVYTFDPNQAPAPGDIYGVRTHQQHAVNSLGQQLFNLPLGPYTVTAQATAMFDNTPAAPRLVHTN